MATTTKTFTFDASVEGFTGYPAGTAVMSRITGDGSPGAGCLQCRLTGKNQNPGTSYWEWVGTFEDLGVPAGATVSAIGYGTNNDYNWRCSEYTTGTGTNAVGPFAIYDNTPTLIGTFSAIQGSVTGTTTWATVNGSSVALSDLASNTTIRLRIENTLRTGNSNSAAVAMLQDQIVLEIEYVTGGATLVMNDAFHGLISDSPVLVQSHVLVSIDAFHGLISDVPTLTQKHILVVVDTVHSHSSDGDLVLTQKSTLVVSETVHSNSADEPVLTQKHTLTVNDTAHGHTVDGNIALSQKHILSVSSTDHGLISDNIDLDYSEGVELIVQDAFHGMTSDVPVLIQVHTLVISDTAHLHSSDATVLTQKHTLVVNDTLHGLISDNITLDYSESVELVVSDCFHGLTSDEPVLTQSHVLTVNDTAHAQIVDEPVLTQKHALVPLDAFHTQTADGDLILVESGGSTVLVIQDAVHGLTSDIPTLTQKHTLSVNDSTHSQIVDLIIIQFYYSNLIIEPYSTPSINVAGII